MTIKARCPGCGEGYNLADTMVGKKVKCRACERIFPVKAIADDPPGEEEVMEVEAVEDAPRSRPRDRDRDRDDRRRDRDDDRPRRSRRDDEDEDDRPRRKPAAGGMPPWGWYAIGGGGLLLFILLMTCIIFMANSGGSNNLNAANFARVQHGMNETQVIAILGQPTETRPQGMARALVYRSSAGTATVILTNNRVTGTSASLRR